MNNVRHINGRNAFIDLYILSKDRPNFILEAVESALAQKTDYEYQVIVSDNSEGDEVSIALADKKHLIHYIKRRPHLLAHEHFNLVVNESKAEFIVLFHDDDRLLDNYLQTMTLYLLENTDIGAVGSNSYTIKENKRMKRLLMGRQSEVIKYTNYEKFINLYLDISLIGPAAFPSYMFRRECLNYYREPEAGIYSDISTLLKTMEKKPIAMLPEPLMEYRNHQFNDSKNGNIYERLKLMRFLYKNYNIPRTSLSVRDMRFRYYLEWLKKINILDHLKRKKTFRVKVTLVFIFLHALNLFFLRKIGFQKVLYERLGITREVSLYK
jgi:hypothetical protein